MILTFTQLAAAFHAAEDANRTPLARVCRALDPLREALAEMEPAERGEILSEIQALIIEQIEDAWCTEPIVARED